MLFWNLQKMFFMLAQVFKIITMSPLRRVVNDSLFIFVGFTKLDLTGFTLSRKEWAIGLLNYFVIKGFLFYIVKYFFKTSTSKSEMYIWFVCALRG